MLSHTAKTARPSFPHRQKIPQAKGHSSAHTRESLSWLQGPGLSPPHPAWEARGTRAPAVGTEVFWTRQTCSLHLRGPATPCPKPSGQPNQPGQVWAGMPGTAVTALHLQPARLPTTGVLSALAVPLENASPALGLLFAGSGHLHLQQRYPGQKARFDTYPISLLRDKKQQCKVITPAGKSPKQVEEAQRGSSVG